jgi:integrase/recombinase XerD
VIYDIHHFAQRVKTTTENIRKDEKLSDENKLAILKFIEFSQARGLSPATIIKDTSAIRQIAIFLGKPFDQAIVEDIVKVSRNIEDKDWSERTKRNARITLKKFYKWLRKTDDYPDEVRWMKNSGRVKDKRLPDILTEEEVLKLVDAADNPRDRALAMTLYESGCRVGELLTARIKNVTFNENGATITVTGKTGPRRILLISSAPLLGSWLENHPAKNNPDALLWVTKFNRISGEKHPPLGYAAVNKLLDNLGKRAGIPKRIYPHLFRHTRATHLANKLTEAQMKQLFGWTPDSGMASVYVHLSGRDVDNALLELHGLRTKSQNEPKIRLKICPRCSERNSPDAKYCKRCALTLDVEVMEWENKMMNELIKQPQVANYLRRMLAQTIRK